MTEKIINNFERDGKIEKWPFIQNDIAGDFHTRVSLVDYFMRQRKNK